MKVACNKCNKVIDADYVKRENWLKVQTDCSTFLLCKHCADGFWMSVDSELPPVVKETEAKWEKCDRYFIDDGGQCSAESCWDVDRKDYRIGVKCGGDKSKCCL